MHSHTHLHLPIELISCILEYYELPFHILFLRNFQQQHKKKEIELKSLYTYLTKMLFGYRCIGSTRRQVFLVFPCISLNDRTILPFLAKREQLSHLLAQLIIGMKDLVSIYSCEWFHDEIKILPTQKSEHLTSVIMQYHKECSFDPLIMMNSKNIETVKLSNTAIEDYSKFTRLKTLHFMIHTSDTLLLEKLILPESITDLQLPYRYCQLVMKLPKLKALRVHNDSSSSEPDLLVDIFKLNNLTSLYIGSCYSTLKLSYQNLASLPLIRFSTDNELPVEYCYYLEQNTSIRHLKTGRLLTGCLSNRFIQQLKSLDCSSVGSQDIDRIIEFGNHLNYLSIGWKYHVNKLPEQLEHLVLYGITFGTVHAIPITLRRLELTKTTIDDSWVVKLSTHETLIQELLLLRRYPSNSFSTEAVHSLFSKMKSLSELKISGIIAPELLVNAKLRKLNLVMGTAEYMDRKTIIRELYAASSHIPEFGIDNSIHWNL
jgi:hypothetical protein